MRVGFFTVFRTDPQHQVHATSLVMEARALMPDVRIRQLTDDASPIVAGVHEVARRPTGPMLERRLEHYASCDGEWLLLDTDVSLRQDVRAVFDDQAFDVALADRDWPHVPQGDRVLHDMPFNTGVAFSRSTAFWSAVLDTWRARPEPRDWMSEQRAVAVVVRSGRFRVKVLPGMTYNYPPLAADDFAVGAALVHYKGPRKTWLTQRVYRTLAEAVCV